MENYQVGGESPAESWVEGNYAIFNQRILCVNDVGICSRKMRVQSRSRRRSPNFSDETVAVRGWADVVRHLLFSFAKEMRYDPAR
jgi:hypothetical protein